MSGMGEESFSELVSRVIDDAKEVARAEIDLVKAQAMARIAGYRSASILFAVAGLLAFVGLIGLVVGLIMTLTPRIGPGWATTVVIGVTFVLTTVLGWLGLRRWKQG